MLKWLYQRFQKKPYEVSIVIPTYDNVEFLEECISSVITSARKCCEYEILLGIDNCKKTLLAIQSINCIKDKHIKIYYFPKRVGPYIIKNSLVNKAKYDNVLFFDSDDIMMPNMMQTIMENFDGKELLKFKFYNFENNDKNNRKLSDIYGHGVFCIKKKTFEKMNGFFGWKCGADTEFAERYEGQGNKVDLLNIPLFYRRYHEKNITRLKETGLASKIRGKYSRIILDNRINQKWNNPDTIQMFQPNIINL